ncbi:MAG: LamG domain-containing protein [Kofleriaceae bacterium]
MRCSALPLLFIVAACGEVVDRPTDLIDDGFDDRFGAGVFAGTRWVQDHVELDPGGSTGTFVSRVFDSGAARAEWNRLRWLPGAPYGKALPDRGESESGYDAGNFSMQQNVLLAHFDDTVRDSSELELPLLSTKLDGYVPGKFGRALADAVDGYVYTKVDGASSPLNFGTQDFSWSLWARTTAVCPGNAVYMGLENPGTGLRPHLWLGCMPAATPTGLLGNTFCSTRSMTTSDCSDVAGKTRINDGQWRHLAIVKAGHQPGTLTTYVDGVLQGSVQTSYSNALIFDQDVEFAIGAFSRGTYPAVGEFDEAAVWRRALTAEEVIALYRRGAQRLLIQLRACEEPSCSSVPFVGPDGDPQRWYTDPASAVRPGQLLLTTAVIGRYVQYQVKLETDEAGGPSPALYSLSLGRAE